MNNRLWWMVFASGIAFGMAILLLIMIVAGRLPAEPAELQYKIQFNARTGEMSPVVEIMIDPLPADPCQRVAAKALRGDYGLLNTRQQKAYELLLLQGLTEADLTVGLATAYGPWEGYDYGEACAHGYGCSDMTLAANAIPGHWYVLVERSPGKWQVRQVQDTGAAWNDRHWRAYGKKHFGATIDCWIDLFLPHDIDPQPMRMLKIRATKTW